MESKRVRLIRKLYQEGWRVSEEGLVIKPDGTVRNATERKGKDGRTNYMKFNVKFEGSSYPVSVHQLCSYQLYGEESFTVDCTRHFNGNSLDNRPDNIVIGSHSENSYDRTIEDRLEQSLKGSVVQRRFNEAEIEFIRNSKLSLRELSEKYNCSKSTVSYIRNGKTYKQESVVCDDCATMVV